MHIQTLRSFVKTAVALQLADNDTPPGYREVLAAVHNRYPDLDREEPRPNKIVHDPHAVKLAVSEQWVADKTTRGAASASNERLMGFHKRRSEALKAAPNHRMRMKNLTATFAAENERLNRAKKLTDNLGKPGRLGKGLLIGGAAATAAGLGAHLYKNRDKQASVGRHAWEIGHLGVLGAPAAAELAGKHVSDKKKQVAEVVGLGGLATPYIHDLASKNPRYAGSAVGRAAGKLFGHGL